MSVQATDGGRLGPRERRAALDRMADEVMDVVIVGGGITGAGTALDAATRGLSVAWSRRSTSRPGPPAGPAS
jgi:glycerol-3-phosphate dehydrogenase